MTTVKNVLNLKIPGKVIINGSYIVLEGEIATCVTVDKYLHLKCVFKQSNNFGFSVNIKDRENYDHLNDKNHYLWKIVESTFGYLNLPLMNIYSITGFFDDGFFFENNVKSGLGSSACLFTGIVYSILKFTIMADKTINKEDFKFIDETYTFSNILYKINKSMNPLSSSCDIISCLMGPINFSYKSIETIFIREKYLILGSFGKSTSTRFMLTFIKDLNWSKVKLLNKSIIFERNKISYEKYLDEIAFLSDIIVPKAQYNILKETFRFNILGCGISGAGGEDAVWVITNNKDELVKFWKKKFSIVFACNLIDHGLKEYD